MKLWSWYAHSWYPGSWEIGFDLRRWAVGVFFAQGEAGLLLGPIGICYDRSLCPW